LQVYSHSLDSELQQRSCEYLAMIRMPNDDLLRTVCDEMPPFPERTSALLSRLDKKSGAGDKRTWSVVGKDGIPGLDRSATLKRNFNSTTLSPDGATNGANGGANGGAKTPTEELAGLDLGAPNLASASHLSPNWEAGYNRLLVRSEGILYEDSQIQIGLRSEYRAEAGCVILYFTNKSSAPIQSFTTTLDNPSAENLQIVNKSLPDTTVRSGEQTSQTIMLEARGIFTDPPTIRISYVAGALQALTLKLPVVLHKYMEHAVLPAEDFFKRWKQIGGAPREAQKIFPAEDVSSEHTRKALQGFRWCVLDGVDPNPRNFVGATVLHTAGGKFGCLLRLEPNGENKVSLFFLSFFRVLLSFSLDCCSPLLVVLLVC
jgi:AP-2 complex subunit alpha